MPMNPLHLIVVGSIAVWLAGQVMKGDRYGVLADTVIGIMGGIVGGWMFGMFGIGPGEGLIGSIVVAFAGTLTLAQINRAVRNA
jgi:uncharacterized membrane protein YeaQ/YmgE (transglycosylase-associated protein family)